MTSGSTWTSRHKWHAVTCRKVAAASGAMKRSIADAMRMLSAHSSNKSSGIQKKNLSLQLRGSIFYYIQNLAIYSNLIICWVLYVQKSCWVGLLVFPSLVDEVQLIAFYENIQIFRQCRTEFKCPNWPCSWDPDRHQTAGLHNLRRTSQMLDKAKWLGSSPVDRIYRF